MFLFAVKIAAAIFAIISGYVVIRAYVKGLKKKVTEELFVTRQNLKQLNEELQVYKNQLYEMSCKDYLTGLPNRMSLYESLRMSMEKYANMNMALLYIDSDNFKFLNDTLGHSFGDQLIIEIGSRLSSMFGSDYIVHRLGGDEFVIFLSNYVNLEEVEQCAAKIIRHFKEPLNAGGGAILTTVSIGIALYPEHGTCTEELLKCAGIAMHKAKSTGKNRFVYYSPAMNKSFDERML
ncbi:MAG: GGDEF domain-containing protein, partial [Bacillota bacterium]|nr:GGDEF domain-containing protein [Bacillota bacterium]